MRDGELGRARYTLRSYLLWMSGITYWYTRWRRIARFARGVVTEPYLPPQRHAQLRREACAHLAGYAAIAAACLVLRSTTALWLWLAPLLAMKCVHQLQNTIEHLGLTHDDDVYRNTRSTRTNALMHWLGWQMQYHTAHHAHPGVPFHQLRRLDELLFKSAHAGRPAMTYWAFQVAFVRALRGGRTEADYADDVSWI